MAEEQWERYLNLSYSFVSHLSFLHVTGNLELHYKRFDRIRKWKEGYYIGEEIRIAYLGKKVIVAYTEGDAKQEVTSFFEIKESKWADKNIWPMFEKEIIKH